MSLSLRISQEIKYKHNNLPLQIKPLNESVYIKTKSVLIDHLRHCSSKLPSSKKDELHLMYKDILYYNEVIDEIKSYDSKTTIYQVKQLYPDGNYKTKTVTVNLTQKNIKEIHDLYLKLQPKNLHNCLFTDNNELLSSSAISFNKNENEDHLPCNTDWEDKEKYSQIEAKLYEFILPTYRLTYPDEFVEK